MLIFARLSALHLDSDIGDLPLARSPHVGPRIYAEPFFVRAGADQQPLPVPVPAVLGFWLIPLGVFKRD
jgi:hypothetical protein